jgi:outer membrane protein assembly factor BamB
MRTAALASVLFVVPACSGVRDGSSSPHVAAPSSEDSFEPQPVRPGAADGPAAQSSSYATDWPQFLGPTGDGKSPETGILTDWGDAGPPIVWQRELGESYGIGTVSRGRYYQFDRAGDRAVLLCLDTETGELLWEFGYPTDYVDHYGYNGGPRCSPVVDGDRVYLFGVGGMLHCVATGEREGEEPGEVIWKVDTAERFGVVQNFFGVGSTPVVEGDLLIAMIGGSPPDSETVARRDFRMLQGNGSGIVAFDKHTGEVKYAITDELASYAGPRLATIEGRRWSFVFARGGLVGFEPTSGKVDFHYPWRADIIESVNAATPVVVGDEVFISETYGPGSSLLKVRPGGYDVVWKDGVGRDKAMQCHWATPIHHNGYLYGCSGRHTRNAELRCIEWNTGRVVWSETGLTRTSLLYVDGHFVCLGEDGVLRLIRATPETYTEVAACRLRDPEADSVDGPPLLDYPAWAAPILSHGLLYARGRDRVVCLRLIDKPDPVLWEE